jgi:Flp pilus assembly protein TadD
MPEAYNNLAIALLRANDATAAVGAASNAVAIKPDYAEAHYSLALALKAAGRLAEATRELESAYRLNPRLREGGKNGS